MPAPADEGFRYTRAAVARADFRQVRCHHDAARHAAAEHADAMTTQPLMLSTRAHTFFQHMALAAARRCGFIFATITLLDGVNFSLLSSKFLAARTAMMHMMRQPLYRCADVAGGAFDTASTR